MHSEPVLKIDQLSKTYRGQRWFVHEPPVVPAIAGISLSVACGSRLAIVGASGSGKSTLARCIVLRERPSAGRILFEGRDVLAFKGRCLREFLRAVQLIPQDPGASLNPRLPAWHIVSEPLLISRGGNRKQRRAQAIEWMSVMGLQERSADWMPAQFSGGQRARLALARAMASNPKVLILDESLASLDLSIQAQMVNLLLDLQSKLGLTYIMISHDLAMAGHFADRVAVLDEGRIAEEGAPEELFRRPSHPRTQALVGAAPVLTRAASG
jgi:ABC-type glutathione transport system ATPase component